MQGAQKSFGDVQVLQGIDLNIMAGERVALMGPSGSGKSTLLNCICGIEPLDSGTIKVGGKVLVRIEGWGGGKATEGDNGICIPVFPFVAHFECF